MERICRYVEKEIEANESLFYFYFVPFNFILFYCFS